MSKISDELREKKQAYLVERDANASGGTYEIWYVENERGIYVDYNPRPFLPSDPETCFSATTQAAECWMCRGAT